MTLQEDPPPPVYPHHPRVFEQATPSTGPGWYRDPEFPASLHYFDGRTWTGQLVPDGPVHATAAPHDRGDYASGGLQFMGVLMALLIPVIGFVIGIVLCNKRGGAGAGVVSLILSVLSAIVWYGALTAESSGYGY